MMFTPGQRVVCSWRTQIKASRLAMVYLEDPADPAAIKVAAVQQLPAPVITFWLRPIDTFTAFPLVDNPHGQVVQCWGDSTVTVDFDAQYSPDNQVQRIRVAEASLTKE